MQEFFINKDGFRIHAKIDFPTGMQEIPYNITSAPVKFLMAIVVHGLTGHMEEEHIIAAAKTANEEGYVTLRVEMYGHGMTDGSFRYHTVSEWVLELCYVIDYARSLPFVSASDIILMGHSQGGLSTILTAGLKKDQLKAIIPLAPAINIRDGARSGDLLGTSFDPENMPDLMPFANREISSNYFRTARVLPVEEAIDSYDRPVLIVHARTDEAVPYSCGENAAARYKNAKLVTINGGDHCYNGHITEMTEAIREFLIEIK